jgi:two-component system chemotaxis sensor kinase CheA
MDDLLAEFIAESREMLDALGEAIVAWEAAPGDRTRLDEIFRFVHTVKGNSGFFDMPRLGALSHAAEDALAEVRSGKRAASGPLVTAVLAIIDRIGALVHALESGDPAPAEDDQRLIAALKAQAVPEAAAPVAAPEPRKAVRSIRLSVDLLDQMMSGVSDMVLARNELARRLRETPADPAVGEAFERVSACIAEMRDAIMRTRMQRIDALFLSLPRLVRDLAAELGKTVELEVDGGDVELDREMIETIRDPLTHIIRNAVDHGIESAADRAKAGKPAKGCLQVCARQSGNQILIEISDDGRGIDGDALVRKAVAAGVIGAEEGARLSPAERASLVFEAGLSTAQAVTSISGRGVGMDVVRANIERIGGVVEIDSRPGQGLRLTLRVPLTLTIIPALTVSAGGQVYAIPRSAIEEIVRCRSNAVRIDQVGGAAMASIRERRLPLVSLAASLGLQPAVAAMDQSLIVLKPAGGELYALAVDAVHDHEELVIKPAAALLMGIGLYAGTTLADDGSPVLLLDPSGLAADAGVLQDSREAPVVLQPEAQRETGAGFAVPRAGRREAGGSPGRGRTDRGRAGRSRAAQRRAHSRGDRRSHPAAGRMRRQGADGQAAAAAHVGRGQRACLWLCRSDRHRAAWPRPHAGGGAGRDWRRRPDRIGPGGSARPALAVRGRRCRADRACPAAGLPDPGGRSLDEQHIAPDDRGCGLPGAPDRAGSGRRCGDQERRGRVPRPGQYAAHPHDAGARQ